MKFIQAKAIIILILSVASVAEKDTKPSHLRKMQSTTENVPKFKSAIMMIPDGCDEAVQTLARWYKGGDLQLDSMANADVKIHMANSVITGSAAAATAFATGHKSTVRFLGVGPRSEDLLEIYDPWDFPDPYSPMASLLEASKLKGKSTGLVATSRITHATPAAFACHIDDRGKDNDIMEHLVYNNIDVVFGGGKQYLLPNENCTNAVEGGKRTDCQNLVDVLKDRGYQIVENKYHLNSLKTGRAWGMFEMNHMQPDIDRQYFAEHEPSLSEMTAKAIELLSQNEEGFFLVVEGSQIDWAGHNNDPIYMTTDFIAFDEAVKVAVDYAKDSGDTLILAFPDHNTGGMKIGNYLHGYTNVTVSDLVDPLRGMTMTANGIVANLNGENTTAEEMILAVQEYWGMNITQEDYDDIMAYRIKISEGMEYNESLSYAMARSLSDRYTFIGWTTHGHNGETVPMWIYGDDAPKNVIENTDLAWMVAEGLGLDLDAATQELFVNMDDLGNDLPHDMDVDSPTNPTITIPGVGVLPIGKDYVEMDGEQVMLPGVTVYTPKTGKCYMSAKGIDMLTSAEAAGPEATVRTTENRNVP